jgi:hypothetical protein
MPLSRIPFVFFGAGYSYALLINQVILGLSEVKPALSLVFVAISWAIYLTLQSTKSWSDFEYTSPPWYTYLNSASTFFYNITVCGILQLSINRFISVNPRGKLRNIVEHGGLALNVVILLVRTARTILIFIQNSGSSVFPISTVLHMATIFSFLAVFSWILYPFIEFTMSHFVLMLLTVQLEQIIQLQTL